MIRAALSGAALFIANEQQEKHENTNGPHTRRSGSAALSGRGSNHDAPEEQAAATLLDGGRVATTDDVPGARADPELAAKTRRLPSISAGGFDLSHVRAVAQ
jgi:hypothetical protein